MPLTFTQEDCLVMIILTQYLRLSKPDKATEYLNNALPVGHPIAGLSKVTGNHLVARSNLKYCLSLVIC